MALNLRRRPADRSGGSDVFACGDGRYGPDRDCRSPPQRPDTLGVAGAVPPESPSFHIPNVKLTWAIDLLSDSVAIAFLGLLEALAIAKSIAHQTRQPLDFNRQCLAEGLANLAGGFFQCLPGSGSLSRSAINFQAGAASRFSGVLTAVFVAIAVIGFAPLARYVPKPA